MAGGGHGNPSALPGSGVDVCATCDDYEIELCAVLSGKCDYVGHAFIAIDGMAEDGTKTGEKVVVGFYPKKDQDFRGVFTEGSGRVSNVVPAPGQVRDDSDYYGGGASALYGSKMWKIGFVPARSAHQFIYERTANPGQYSLWTRQCNNFALEVLTRAGIAIAEFLPSNGPVRPAYTYEKLSGQTVPAARYPPYDCLPVTGEIRQGVRDAKQAGQSIADEWNRGMNAIERGWNPF